MAKESAEEKLLKMMKKPSPSVAVKPSLTSPPNKRSKFTFSVDILNIFLLLVIAVCLAMLIIELISGSTSLKRPVEFPRESKNDVSLFDIALPSTPTVDYYLQNINERNIFKPFVPKKPKSSMVSDLALQMSKYKLVGIAWLDLPETASIMIKDTQKNKILFLRAGEQFDGITVKTIYTDRAVFSHENEETTIKL